MADHKTALQLAEEITRRVLRDFDDEVVVGNKYYVDTASRPMSDSVLSVLREHGVWFCRLSETPEGTTQERLPMGDESG